MIEESKLEQSIDFFVSLEKQIWQAFLTGDKQKDLDLLSEDFLGEYPDGKLDRDGHANQLESGPVAESYKLYQPSIQKLPDGQIGLSYIANWVRKGGNSESPEIMKVFSKWKNIDGEWKNTYSKDEPHAS